MAIWKLKRKGNEEEAAIKDSCKTERTDSSSPKQKVAALIWN